MGTKTDEKMAEVHRSLTEQVVSLMEQALESGQTLDWMKPWTDGNVSPRNAKTGHEYRGGNWLWLAMVRHAAGYRTALWATYRQWESLGAQVRKGEKGTTINIFSTGIKRDPKTKKPVLDAKGKPVRYRFWTTATVFNADQCDGVETLIQDDLLDTNLGTGSLHDIDLWFESIGAEERVGNAAYYTPKDDAVTMPPVESFHTTEGYYGTRAHEYIHWTGHKTRLDRGLDEPTVFGSSRYAREELVAELGAVFVLNHLGLTNKPERDHAAYLQSWVNALKGDPSLLWSAASDASKGAQHLIDAADESLLAADAA